MRYACKLADRFRQFPISIAIRWQIYGVYFSGPMKQTANEIPQYTKATGVIIENVASNWANGRVVKETEQLRLG